MQELEFEKWEDSNYRVVMSIEMIAEEMLRYTVVVFQYDN